ncbi:MAG TPA: hypothetical protein EYP85_12240 [Armatimonadetes bacterium]|nr:hypothetical protein [Armatimonadota bacterium]
MEVTLALAILLGVGFIAAKAAQLVRLPSVTGYICAGVVLGPSCLHLITEEALQHQLGHFTQIALMLIAFGIGEHLDLRHLRQAAKSVGYIGLGETSGAFWLVGMGTFLVAWGTRVGNPAWGLMNFITLALLLGAVSVATAPAATLHVMRELRATGPLTKTLMAVVAVDDGLAIIIFGIAMSAARHLVGAEGKSVLWAGADSAAEIMGSLVIGAFAGLLIDFVVHRLKRRGEMLTAGLALLLLAGELARLMHWSPLLTGMATGFTIVNRDRRDVRVFRAINDFEPPIYALFFTLAGAHLQISALATAGYLGAVYALLRVAGKMVGANLGSRLSGAPISVRRWLGLALVPQAGVAIGLIFLIQGDEALGAYSVVITPVVLAAVVLSELVGPACARLAVMKAGEARGEIEREQQRETLHARKEAAVGGEHVQLAPWTWGPLGRTANPQGYVLFGVSDPRTVAGLARIATVLAHYHGARPLAVRVHSPKPRDSGEEGATAAPELFAAAAKEASNLGQEVETQVEVAADVAGGVVATAQARETWAIVLGHPLERTKQSFARVVDAVAQRAPCPVIVVRFAGVLHTERILVPVGSVQELRPLRDVVRALAQVGPHRITLLQMLPPEATEEQMQGAEQELREWAREKQLPQPVSCRAIATEARVETIAQAAAQHDLLVMAAASPRGLPRLFFGSLAEDVAQQCDKPILMVHGAEK